MGVRLCGPLLSAPKNRTFAVVVLVITLLVVYYWWPESSPPTPPFLRESPIINNPHPQQQEIQRVDKEKEQPPSDPVDNEYNLITDENVRREWDEILASSRAQQRCTLGNT